MIPIGYTNVREQRNSNSKIVSKVYDYDVFQFKPENSDWISVELKDGTKGFIHKSRVKEIPVCDCNVPGNGKLGIQNQIRAIMVCGYYSRKPEPKEFSASRFFVVDCRNGKDLLNMSNCDKADLKISNESIEVIVLTRLPIGNNGDLEEVPLRKYSLNLNDTVSRFASTSELNPPYLNSNESAQLIGTIRKSPPKTADQFYQVMGKLLLSALSGNKDAEQMFRDPKTSFGVVLDGFYAEDYALLKHVLNDFQGK